MNAAKRKKTRSARRSVHVFRLAGFTLALSILLILFSLLVAGLPDSLTRKVSNELLEAGIPLQFDSIRLSTHRGWVLQNATLYSNSPDDLRPLFQTEKLYIHLWPEDWSNLKNTAWDIKLYAKNSDISLGRAWETALPEPHPFRIAERISIALTLRNRRADIDKAVIDWGTVSLTGRGEVLRTQIPPAKFSPAEWPKTTAQLVDFISTLNFGKQPEIDITFAIDPASPLHTELDMTLKAGDLLYGNRLYSRLSGRLQFTNQTVRITDAQLLENAEEAIRFSGAFPLGNQPATASVINTLSVDSLLNLMPLTWQDAMRNDPADLSGPLRFTAALGPAPVAELAEHFSADIRQIQLKRKDLNLNPLAFQLTREKHLLNITDLEAGANGGDLSGSFDLNLESGAWQADVNAQHCPLGPVGTLAGRDLQTFFERFSFPAEKPSARLTLSQSGMNQPLFVTGTIEGRQFLCGGVPIDHFQSSMVWSNRTLLLSDIHAEQSRKRFEGDVEVDFNRGLGIFDAAASFHPDEIEHVLAPGYETALDRFRFSGPLYMEARGQIDWRNWTNHVFTGTFHGENIGFGLFQSDLFTSTVKAQGTQLTFTNASAKFYGGTAKGEAEFDLFGKDGSTPYRFDINTTGISLNRLLSALSKSDAGNTRGILSGTLTFTADAKRSFWDSVNGSGRLHVRDGQLADIPLFGGFSRLIRSSFAGFRLFSLNTFFADYQLHDGAFYSDNAELGGTLLSARGQGKWSPETGLDFVVKAEPLRQTREGKEWFQLHLWAADALKMGTSPLFSFLEFKVTGPLNNPEWRFINLPSSITSLLQRRSSSDSR